MFGALRCGPVDSLSTSSCCFLVLPDVSHAHPHVPIGGSLACATWTTDRSTIDAFGRQH